MHCTRAQVAVQHQTHGLHFSFTPGAGGFQVNEALERQRSSSSLQRRGEQVIVAKRWVNENQVQAGRCALAQLSDAITAPHSHGTGSELLAQGKHLRH